MANFLVDYIKYICIVVLFIILIFIFDIKFLYEESAIGAVILLCFFFGTSFILQNYFFSFIFRSSNKAQAIIFLFSISSSTFLIIFTFGLRVSINFRNFVMYFFEYILMFIPQFSFCYGLLHLANIKLYMYIYNWPERPSSLSSKVALNPIIYLIFTTFLFLLIIILFECYFSLYSYKNEVKNKEIKEML